jgi:hypothetical protein
MRHRVQDGRAHPLQQHQMRWLQPHAAAVVARRLRLRGGPSRAVVQYPRHNERPHGARHHPKAPEGPADGCMWPHLATQGAVRLLRRHFGWG